jgi:hypothetical protein
MSMERLITVGLLAFTGCGTMNSARPLSPGEHALGVTLGGPMVEFSGAYIPLPNLIVEGRSGLNPLAGRPLDLNYGLNLTGMAFGVVGLHGGASWQLVEQDGFVPAVTLSDRLWLYNNYLDLRKDASQRRLWAVDQIEFTGSYAVGRSLVYFGLAEYLDFAMPDLVLTPFLGSEIRPGDRVGLQLELRHYGINQVQPVETVTWLSPGSGAVGVLLGFRYDFGLGE